MGIIETMNNAINLLDLLATIDTSAELAATAAAREIIAARVAIIEVVSLNGTPAYKVTLDGKPTTRVIEFNRSIVEAQAAQLVLSLTLEAGCAA